MKKAVLVLHADEMGRLWRCRGLCLAKLLQGEVGASDFPNLPGLNELVQGTQRVGNWNCRVWRVELIEIDVIGAKPPQTVLSRLKHVLRPGSAPLFVDL